MRVLRRNSRAKARPDDGSDPAAPGPEGEAAPGADSAVSVPPVPPEWGSALRGAAAPLLSLAARLQNGAALPDLRMFELNLVAGIRSFEQAAQEAGLPASRVVLARFALCALFDDLLRLRGLAPSGEGLVTRFHPGLTGEGVVTGLIDRLRAEPGRHTDLLAFLALCLAAGLRGGAPEAGLTALRRGIAADLEAVRVQLPATPRDSDPGEAAAEVPTRGGWPVLVPLLAVLLPLSCIAAKAVQAERGAQILSGYSWADPEAPPTALSAQTVPGMPGSGQAIRAAPYLTALAERLTVALQPHLPGLLPQPGMQHLRIDLPGQRIFLPGQGALQPGAAPLLRDLGAALAGEAGDLLIRVSMDGRQALPFLRPSLLRALEQAESLAAGLAPHLPGLRLRSEAGPAEPPGGYGQLRLVFIPERQ